MELDKLAAFWLAQIVGIGPVGAQILTDIFGSTRLLFLSSTDEVITRIRSYGFTTNYIEEILSEFTEDEDAPNKKTRRYQIPAAVRDKLADARSRIEIVGEYERIQKASIRFIIKNDTDYPACLRHIPAPPEQLFVWGRLPAEGQCAIGVVGARDCSPYGRDMARLFGYRLAQAGIAVISGMARGVDGWAHRGALEADGDTYAVLGCGVEVCYPRSNGKLYRDIREKGGLISEYPTGYGPLAANFPLRNRIISGLSDGILVVEARIRSGSLITADAALDQGKDVFVIPGRIGDELSIGCNRLIRQGAIPVLSPDDIIEYYHLDKPVVEEVKLTPEEQKLLDQIGSTPISLATLASTMQGTYANTLRLITRLRKNRYIRETSRDHYIRV